MKKLERQFKQDCDPLQQLYEKKSELQKIDKKLAEAGYVDPAEQSESESESRSESPKLRRSAVNRSFNKQRTAPSNPPNRGKKKSISPIKQASKTGNDFYSKSGFFNLR